MLFKSSVRFLSEWDGEAEEWKMSKNTSINAEYIFFGATEMYSATPDV